MKKSSIQGVYSYPCAKKLLMGINIALLLFAFNFSFAAASSGSYPSDNGKSNIKTGNELQQLTISGTVTDEASGDPMPGVNIVVKGTSIGTLSDINGKYSISAA